MKRSFAIIVIFVALAMLGCALIPRLTVKLMPSRTLPSLTVSFSMPNAASRVVEREVTAKLEGLLARIQGVKEIRSMSNNGGGSITIGFDKHTDMEHVRFEASTIIRQAWPELPSGVSYPSVSASRTISRSGRPVLSYTIISAGRASEIMKYAEENIRPVIGRIDGVDRVQIYGATPMEWRLTYDSDRLKALGLTPYQIQNAIASQSQRQFLGSGMTESGEWLALVCADSPDDRSEFDISQIYVSTADSTLVSLDRLVTAEHADAEPTSYYRVNGLTSIYCNIYATEDANQIDVAKRVRKAVAELDLPNGYAFKLNYDSTESISEELDKIYKRSGLTLLILLIFVAVITINLRYMTMIMISLMLSLGISVILFYFMGIEIQLYSLAGITISLNLMIDNIIVMGDHYRRRRDRRAFSAILAATLTTIGALGIVFFLDDDLRLNLQDFVAVVIINLMVSLAAALWLVPALMDRMGVVHRSKRLSRRRARIIARISRCYAWFIGFGRRWRWAFILAAILAFGLPVFMLPKEIDGCELYNKTFGSKTYNEKLRPWVDRIFGGALRLFVEDVYEGSYFNRDISEPVLQISASLPNGSTLEQMNGLVKKMERYVAEYSEVRQFRTDIYSPYQANISVQFTKEALRKGFQYRMKDLVISKALTLGGGSWSVYGLDDRGFSNNVSESAGSYQVKLVGYNYDQLEKMAEQFRTRLLSHKRIKEVTISSEFSWYKNLYTEYVLEPDREAMAREDVSASTLYRAMTPIFGRNIYCGTTDGGEQIYLSSRQGEEYDVWALMNIPFLSQSGRMFRVGDFASLERSTAPRSVEKENQQYLLCLQFDYIGSPLAGRKVLDKEMEEFSATLPVGFTISNAYNQYGWGNASATNYWLIVLIMVIIFFTTAVLFNSLRLPLIVIAMIPLSFVGVFLTFYLTGVNFDQGGFASLVLLCGITVNAAIYLINEYTRSGNYIRAFNVKIIPIMLTVVSTMLGFIPFLIGREAFWYPLAVGTIGGLATSFIALVIYLPLFVAARSGHRAAQSGTPAQRDR